MKSSNFCLLTFLLISSFLINSSLVLKKTSKNLKKMTSSSHVLTKCTNVKQVSGSRTQMQADCPDSDNTIVTSKIDLATCFYDNGGQLRYLPRDQEISGVYFWSIDSECEHLYMLVDKVTVYYKDDGKTKSKVVQKDGPYYLNGYCYKYWNTYQSSGKRKQGWSYINIYDYVFYDNDGELYC